MIWFGVNGQTGPVFPYNNPSKQTIFKLASSQTLEGEAYSSYMTKAVNLGLRDTDYKVSSVGEIFSHLHFEDITLVAGSYINSGYNKQKHEMVQSVGNAWSGFAWVYRMGTYAIILLKGDCGNVLEVEVVRSKVTPPTNAYVPPPRDVTGYVPAPRQYTPPIKPAPTLKNKFPWAWVVVAAIVGGGTAYELSKKKAAPVGKPGGAPSTTGGDTGGPGGAPSTTNVSPMNSFVLNRTMTVPKSVVFVPVKANTAIGFGISKHGASASFTFNF